MAKPKAQQRMCLQPVVSINILETVGAIAVLIEGLVLLLHSETLEALYQLAEKVQLRRFPLVTALLSDTGLTVASAECNRLCFSAQSVQDVSPDGCCNAAKQAKHQDMCLCLEKQLWSCCKEPFCFGLALSKRSAADGSRKGKLP